MTKLELTKVEQNIVNDILARSNYSKEEAEKIARTCSGFGYSIHEQDYYKLKNAIKILKEKKVDIPKLLANDFNNYNALAVFFGFKQLTQEEYELLKEVFKNVE